MVDIESEFEKLKQEMAQKIADRVTAGELTAEEAERLTNMVYDRMPYRDEYYQDDGWDPSQRCW
jgi:hypothetical protein